MMKYFQPLFFIVLTFLFLPFLLITILLKKKDYNKILVIQTAKIGDLICTTPVFREIKKHYPQSFLSVLVIQRAKDVLNR